MPERRATIETMNNIYDKLRAAIREMDISAEVRARDELVQAHVIGFNEAMQIPSALAALRAFFQKLDDNGR